MLANEALNATEQYPSAMPLAQGRTTSLVAGIVHRGRLAGGLEAGPIDEFLTDNRIDLHRPRQSHAPHVVIAEASQAQDWKEASGQEKEKRRARPQGLPSHAPPPPPKRRIHTKELHNLITKNLATVAVEH